MEAFYARGKVHILSGLFVPFILIYLFSHIHFICVVYCHALLFIKSCFYKG